MRKLVWLIAITGALPGAGWAQQASNVGDEIVVTGKTANVEQVRRDARKFTRQIAASPVEGQLARWNEPVCPRVAGVDPPVQAIVAARIRAIASAAGAKLGAANCRANVVVTFTGDARALAAAVGRRSARAFGIATRAERDALTTGDAPVRWWYAAQGESADGQPFVADSPALLGLADFPRSGNESYSATFKGSVVDTQMRASLKSVAVLVDVNAATGRSLADVASYVAFVALGHVRMGAPVPDRPSILGLFATGRGERRGLSQWDSAYLAALYEGRANRAANAQRSAIGGDMARRVLASADGP